MRFPCSRKRKRVRHRHQFLRNLHENVSNNTENLPLRYDLRAELSYVEKVMRCAFVVRLGCETKPSEGRFEGWVEEVDTGNELRFRSKDELFKFLGERFEAVSSMELDGGRRGSP